MYKLPKTSSILAFTLILILFLSSSILAVNQLTTHFLDVGQADSILLQLPNGQTMLIDAGNNDDGPMVVNYIKSQGINKIDYLIGTHPHEDHIGGLDNVIRSFDIGKIYMPRVTTNTKTFEDVLLAIKNKGKKITAAKAGMVIVKDGDLKASILSPISDDYEDLNNWSVVIKVTYGSTSFLFTGDAEDIVEEQLLASGENLKADVLKVGHHGSHSSTTEPFLKAISPQYGVISVGKDNDYGHPSPIVLDRLRDHGVKVFRTDEQGTIIANSDGKTITFNKKAIAMENNTPDESSGVEIVSVDLKAEVVVIKNNGDKSVDISGWKLVSVKGNQVFFFPAGTVLGPGEIIKIATGKKTKAGPGVIVWTKKYIWNNDGDAAELYDDESKLVSIFY